MAALTSSPSGFSYAQAARGKAAIAASQTSSSKVNSGTATPATGTFSELTPGSNWADDVDAPVSPKTSDAKDTSPEQSKAAPVKDSAVERTKSESRTQHASSLVSSPDLAATSSTTTNTDESSSAANGTSSDTTWETKSQNSEPAWIAERKERQSGAQDEGQPKGKRGKKDPKEATEPALPQPPMKPVVLQEAPPPSVNPWAKRLESGKVKVVPVPSSTQAAKPAATSTTAQDENQRPRADSRRKANSIAGAAHEPDSRLGAGAKKQGSFQDKRITNGHGETEGLKAVAGDDTATAPSKPAQREHQSLPNINAIPPPVKDEVSWPTPESAQEQERKESPAEREVKEGDDTGDSESINGAKIHTKTKWKPIAVTPSIVWQTEEMNRPSRGQNGERGERGGRGNSTTRGRGGFRGTNGGPKGGDRAHAKSAYALAEGETTNAGPRRQSVDLDGSLPALKLAHLPPFNSPREGSGAGEQPNGDRHAFRELDSGVLADGNLPKALSGASSIDSRRITHPAQKESTAFEGLDHPQPISRGDFTPASTETGRDGAEHVRAGSTIRRVPSDSKKEYRAEGYAGKEWNGAPRGNKRNGRGRGLGSRELTNGHQPSQIITNGYADFGAGGYPVPPSPSAYHSSRQPWISGQQGRGGWPRHTNGVRSQSIPVENGYGSRPLRSPQQFQPMQAYYPGMYEYNFMPMSAMPYTPTMDHQYLMDMVTTQLDYYFSIDNLLKDMFLRKNMDSQGFVFLDFIANFNRIKQLTTDKDLLRACCMRSEHIDIRIGEDSKERLRKREGWEAFPLPMEQRETSAQNDGATTLRRPERAPSQFFPPPQMPLRGPPSAGLPRPSYDSGYAMNGAVPQFMPFSSAAEGSFGEVSYNEERRGRAAKSPTGDNNRASPQPAVAGSLASHDVEGDAFLNENLNTLTVVVKMYQSRPPHQHAATRTFSNGSIDTRSIAAEMERPIENHALAATNGDVAHGSPIRHASPSVGRSPDKATPSSELTLLWTKEEEVPQENLPQGSTLEPYLALRDKALGQREEAATGTCPYDLDVLYQFWSHFLIRNFNKDMYGEFKFFAHEDAASRHSGVGLQNLVQFYAKALASPSPIRDGIVKDYVELVKSEPPILQGVAFKQLRQAWRNGALNLKNRKKLADILDETLKLQLES